jgi:hypothetical protein
MVDWSTTKRKHGTPSGYQLHRNLGEKACDECMTAQTAAVNRRRSVRIETRSITWTNTRRKHGTDSGYMLHRDLGEDACVACLKAHADAPKDSYNYKLYTKARSAAKQELIELHREQYRKILKKHVQRLKRRAEKT